MDREVLRGSLAVLSSFGGEAHGLDTRHPYHRSEARTNRIDATAFQRWSARRSTGPTSTMSTPRESRAKSIRVPATWIALPARRALNPCTSRRRRMCYCLEVSLLMIPACATVNPRDDYIRSEKLVGAATGVDEVYDPDAEAEGERKVRALLDDGLSVDEAVRVALLNNRAFQAAFLEIGASRADVVQSGLLTNPSVSLSVRFPEGGGLANLTVGFAQQVADLWQIPIRKRVAQAELEQVILSAADRAVRLCADARQAYYQMVAAQEAEALASENLELVQRSVDLANARFGAGEVGQVDVNLVRTNLIDAQLEVMNARREREAAANELSRVLGQSRSHHTWTLTDKWPKELVPDVDDTQLLVIALEHRLDARLAAFRVQAAEAALEREYLSVFPDVTLGLEGERPERRALPGRSVLADTARASIANGGLTAPGIQSRAERRRERSQIIDLLLGPTLDITLPIWDQNQAQIAKAGFRVKQSRAEFEDLLDRVAREVTDALNVIRSAQELVRFYETEALPQSRMSVEAARATYEAGEQSVLVLIEAQGTLIAQRKAQVIAMRDLAEAQAELERAIGIPVPIDGQGDDEPRSINEEPPGEQP